MVGECARSVDVPLPVEYPVACRPQAWSSGAPLSMMRSYGGMTADAPETRVPRKEGEIEVLIRH